MKEKPSSLALLLFPPPDAAAAAAFQAKPGKEPPTCKHTAFFGPFPSLCLLCFSSAFQHKGIAERGKKELRRREGKRVYPAAKEKVLQRRLDGIRGGKRTYGRREEKKRPRIPSGSHPYDWDGMGKLLLGE